MSAKKDPGSTASEPARPGTVDTKLEVVVIPVSDADRAKEFYERLGWRLDADRVDREFRIVQFTPQALPARSSSAPTSPRPSRVRSGPCSSSSPISKPPMKTWSHAASRSATCSTARPGPCAGSATPARRPRARTRSRARQLRLLRFFQRSRRQWLAAAGSHEPAPRTHRSCRDRLRLRARSGQRTSAGVGCPRRAREAHRQSRPRLARLVRRLHGARAIGRGTASVSHHSEHN